MQALVRVQAHVRARGVRVALENETGNQQNNVEKQTDKAHVQEIKASCTPVFKICRHPVIYKNCCAACLIYEFSIITTMCVCYQEINGSAMQYLVSVFNLHYHFT